jgi:hypothetical protein
MHAFAQLWLELARAFLSDDKAEDAQYCADRALRLTPGASAAHHVRGCADEVRSRMCRPQCHQASWSLVATPWQSMFI